MEILSDSRFKLAEFSSRWERARLAALRSALNPEVASSNGSALAGEFTLLQKVRPEQREALTRFVFDNSRKLGQSVSRYLGVSFELSDLSGLLRAIQVPCVGGQWRAHNAAFVLERPGCNWGKELGSLACDYWREALDGLVMGVGENERLARHRSYGHGDVNCEDVLFVEEAPAPRVIGDTEENTTPATHRFGAVPPEVAVALGDACARFEAMKVKLLLKGVSEGVLYYELKADEGVLCGAGGKLLHDSLAREMSQRLPHLTARDVAPLAVYGGAS